MCFDGLSLRGLSRPWQSQLPKEPRLLRFARDDNHQSRCHKALRRYAIHTLHIARIAHSLRAHILSYVCRVSSTLTAYVLLLPTSLLSKTESGVVSLLLKLHLYPNKSQGRFRMYKEPNNQALSTPFLKMFPPSKLRLKRDCLNSVSFHPPMLAVLNQIGLAMSSLFFNFLVGSAKNMEIGPNGAA